MVGGFLVMFKQTGFALLETGLCRAKNTAHTMALNFGIYAVGNGSPAPKEGMKVG
jgi:Amt family ammonium transporter